MTLRLQAIVAALTLVALPACFDPIVGGECKTGYSPCHGVCAPSGACQVLDASGEAAIVLDGAEGEAAVLDGAEGEASSGQDLGDIDADLVGAIEDAATEDEAPGALDEIGAGFPEVAVADGKRHPSGDALDGALDDALDDALDGNIADAPSQVDGTIDLPLDLPLPSQDVAAAPVDAEDAGVAAEADGGCAGCLDGESEAGTPAYDATALDTGPPVCTDPQILCDNQCVDPTSNPQNCGACHNPCATGVCLGGHCLVCNTGETACGQQCVNLGTHPDNCGRCGASCMSGLCNNGQCQAAGTGRVVVIGHDYSKNREAMNRILGNAVFLWPVSPVRLLTYPGDADQAAIDGATAAIDQVTTATGRHATTKAAATSAEVEGDLASADVFLIYGQTGADDTKLRKLGQDWKPALSSFVLAGGTVIVLDAVYASNNGTVQILSQAGLFDITRASDSTGDTCAVVTGGDALAMGLPRTYLCEPNSATFSIGDTAASITTVVADASADSFAPVVVHKLF
jgi:hypothetical protein